MTIQDVLTIYAQLPEQDKSKFIAYLESLIAAKQADTPPPSSCHHRQAD